MNVVADGGWRELSEVTDGAAIAILSPNLIIYHITMQRSFRTEISRNRRPRVELSDAQRAGILSAVEVGEEKTKIAARYRVSSRVIYNIINR